MPYIDGSQAEPNKALYYSEDDKAYSPELAVRYIDRLGEYQRNNTRALGAIKSIISVDNTERFKDKKTPKELFTAIKTTFSESSLELIGRYLDRIIEANYNSSRSMDEYTSQIQSSAVYLKELNYEVPKPFLVWLLFKGLPSSFDSFSSHKYKAITKDLDNIDISKLISDLILEESRIDASIGLEAYKAGLSNNSFCTYCSRKGHIETKCYTKYPELKPSRRSNRKSTKGDSKDSKADHNKDEDNTNTKSNSVIISIVQNKDYLLDY